MPAGARLGADTAAQARAVAMARQDEALARTRAHRYGLKTLTDRVGAGMRGLGPMRRVSALARDLLFRAPFYGLTLGRAHPHVLNGPPPDPWPGDTVAGSAILRGHFCFLGQNMQSMQTIWRPRSASRAWLAEMHGFDWLRDLRALDANSARQRCRDLILNWIEGHAGPRDPFWAPDVIGARLTAWLAILPFCARDQANAFAPPVLRSMARQTRHLARALPGRTQGEALILALKGLILAGLFLPGQERRRERGLKLLEREIRRQVLADGGHVQRSPRVQLAVLRHLIEIRLGFSALNREPPVWVQGAIDRMTPMLRLFRHGDGGLALFNGAEEGEAWRIEMVLAQADMRGKAPPQAPHTGFQRLQANRTLIILDSGAPPPPGLDRDSHAGALSFEMSVAKERLIVNCGAGAPDDDAWRDALRATAAHSTMGVDGADSAELLVDGIGARPSHAGAHREQAGGAVWMEATHDGYGAALGLAHHRRLYLSPEGEDLRGEDVLTGTGGRYFTLRFHLHPTVRAGLTNDGRAVLLRLPSGMGWRMLAAGGHLSIAESIYRGGPEIQRGRQIVVQGALEGGGATVRWALRRETARSAP